MKICHGGEQVSPAELTDTQTIDILDDAGTVRVVRLTGKLLRGARAGAIPFPGLAVGLTCHIGQREHAVLRAQGHLVYRSIL